MKFKPGDRVLVIGGLFPEFVGRTATILDHKYFVIDNLRGLYHILNFNFVFVDPVEIVK